MQEWTVPIRTKKKQQKTEDKEATKQQDDKILSSFITNL